MKKFKKISSLIFTVILSTTIISSSVFANSDIFDGSNIESIHSVNENEKDIVIEGNLDEQVANDTLNFIEPKDVTLADLGVDESSLPVGNVILSDVVNLDDALSTVREQKGESTLPSIISRASTFSTQTYTPDKYEPNNTLSSATPYSNTTKFGVEDDPWYYGYVAAGIHDENDVDIYTVNMKAGEWYFFHLKNKQFIDPDFYVYDPVSGSIYEDGEPGAYNEDSFYLNAPTSRTVYVIVDGLGVPDFFHYFLYADVAQVTRTLRDTTNTGVMLGSTDISNLWMEFDATYKAPWLEGKSVLNSIRIENKHDYYPAPPSSLIKYIRSSDSGRTYSTSSGNNNVSNYQYRTEYVNQKWYIRPYSSSTILTKTYWYPNVYMTYTGFMHSIPLD